MKFESPPEELASTRDEDCLRKFLAGNKIVFAQAFWENGPLKRKDLSPAKVESPLVRGFEDKRN